MKLKTRTISQNKEGYDDSDTIIDGSTRTTPREHKDPFEAEDFDAIQFINSQFPNGRAEKNAFPNTYTCIHQ